MKKEKPNINESKKVNVRLNNTKKKIVETKPKKQISKNIKKERKPLLPETKKISMIKEEKSQVQKAEEKTQQKVEEKPKQKTEEKSPIGPPKVIKRSGLSFKEKIFSIFKKPEKAVYPFVSVKEPKYLLILPDLKDVTKVDYSYPLLEPFVFAHLKWDKEKRKVIYHLEEPKLTDEEKKKLKKIGKDLIEIIDIKYSLVKEKEKLVKYLHKKVATILEETGEILPVSTYVKIMYYIVRDFVGLNEIEPLFHDPYIEDIGCDGLGVTIFIIHRKFGSIETDIVFEDSDHLSDFVVKLAERCGRYISYAQPLLDGSLPDGSRVQSSFSKDVTTRGPTFSIRKFRRNPYSPIDMIRLGTASIDIMAYLWFLTENDISYIICGGVSTGKTTMLNALSTFIPSEDKIVSIEDTREINLPHNNWIPSVTRVGFGMPEVISGKKYGEIDLFDLLKESFRQNPDYVIVGEVRGKEAYVMFQGMASGHPTIGTIHAGSIEDVIKRLETPPINLSPSLIDSLDLLIVMINTEEKGKSSRRIKEVVEIQSIDKKSGKAHSLKTFSWVPSMDMFRENLNNSEILHRISFEKGIPFNKIIEEIGLRKEFFEWLNKNNIIDFKEVANMVSLYKKDKSTVLKWMADDINPFRTFGNKKIKKLLKSSTGLKILN